MSRSTDDPTPEVPGEPTSPRRTPRPRRTRTVLAALAALLLVGGLGAAVAATHDESTVTRARLERALPVVFSHLYTDQAHLLGHDQVTPASLNAKAMCDKHGPTVADVGPGGDWVCLMSWHDPDVPMPTEGYGKFEVNVHSNDCFTAGGPSKLTGFLTMTDAQGREVPNPVFEFDGCFDPQGDTSPTGVEFPSVYAVSSTVAETDAQGRLDVQSTCGTGSEGCAGTAVATAGDTKLGSVDVDTAEESTAELLFPKPLPPGTKEVTITLTTTRGVAPSDEVTLPVRGG
jgi:hypothetical protein